MAALTLSAAGFVGILNREGLSRWLTPDPVHGTKLPTIGFGSTEGVKMGDTITPVAAVNRSLREVQVFENALKACIKVPLHQYEFDAYVELSHNIGPGAFCRSTIVKRLNAGDYPGACRGDPAIQAFRQPGTARYRGTGYAPGSGKTGCASMQKCKGV